ncbi:MAG: ABC transporter permease [Acidobacteriota bacterium]|nr:ABC transporter permease [Acidobacteriota bacterium]
MSFRLGLLGEVVRMAMDTLRTNKLRSALTVLGVVIGITAIVGMTSLIRGFDESLRNSIKEIGPNTIFVQKFGFTSLGSGRSFTELLKRPNLTIGDADAIAAEAPTVKMVDVWLGGGPGRIIQERIAYRNTRTKPTIVMGSTQNFAAVSFIKLSAGRFFTGAEVLHHRKVVVLGHNPYLTLFPDTDPIGKSVRIGDGRFTVIGVLGKRPNPGFGNAGVDDFVVIPETVYQDQYGIDAVHQQRGTMQNVMIVAVPRDGVSRKAALQDVETVMRIRHGLKLDQPDDFDLVTQDEALKVWDRISSATYLGLVVISSIALMVGGIGVMAIMMISVTERTREIGVRKALGARRREILWQFLIEAACLTLVGGVLGVAIGSGIGILVHYLSGFPISLPWWSFALGLGFSASVGIFFGMVPAVRASRLDPIEALRYE